MSLDLRLLDRPSRFPNVVPSPATTSSVSYPETPQSYTFEIAHNDENLNEVSVRHGYINAKNEREAPWKCKRKQNRKRVKGRVNYTISSDYTADLKSREKARYLAALGKDAHAPVSQKVKDMKPPQQLLDRYLLKGEQNPVPSSVGNLKNGPHPHIVSHGGASFTNSNESSASTEAGGVLYCPEPSCKATFSGVYRKGNLARHRRNQHEHSFKTYPCHDPHCNKTFKRQDARLKHERKHHPDLVAASLRTSKPTFVSRRGVFSEGGDPITTTHSSYTVGSSDSFACDDAPILPEVCGAVVHSPAAYPLKAFGKLSLSTPHEKVIPNRSLLLALSNNENRIESKKLFHKTLTKDTTAKMTIPLKLTV